MEIIAPSGLPLRSYGGDDAWKTYRSGDYVVSIQTVEGEPGCVIWPARSLDSGVYAVCLSAYPYWIGLDGRPTQDAYAMAMKGLERMGRELSRSSLIALMGVVIDAFTWVARMPPIRPKKSRPIFEATAMVNGRRYSERLV